jgi:hypothetical protein
MSLLLTEYILLLFVRMLSRPADHIVRDADVQTFESVDVETQQVSTVVYRDRHAFEKNNVQDAIV